MILIRKRHDNRHVQADFGTIVLKAMMIDIDLLLACGASYKKVTKGEIIFMEGSIASFYHQLVEGKVKWFSNDDEGKEYIHHIIQAGESFGEVQLFDNECFAAPAIAVEDSILICLHRSSVENLLQNNPQIHFAFSKLLAERLRFKFMLVKELSCYSPGHRIITLINYLKQSNKNYCSKCHKLLLTRQQIANMTGLRVETVIRAMKDLEEQHMLTIEKGKVYC